MESVTRFRDFRRSERRLSAVGGYVYPDREFIVDLMAKCSIIVPFGNIDNFQPWWARIIPDRDTNVMNQTQITTAKQLGKIIRDRRKAAGLTQKKAAALAGVGTRFLSELERGKPTSQLGKALEILQLLGLTIHVTTRTPQRADTLGVGTPHRAEPG